MQMEPVSVQICFGSSKKWMACESTLLLAEGSLSMIIIRNYTTTARVSSILRQNIPLHNLMSSFPVYHSQRPHCLEIIRQRSQRIFISFKTAVLREEWNRILNQHSVMGVSLRNIMDSDLVQKPDEVDNCKISHEEIQLPIAVKKDDTEEDSSLSDDDSDAESNIYECIENYSRPPVPNKNKLVDKPILQSPPPLPKRRSQLSETDRQQKNLYDDANELLTKIHELTNQLELLDKQRLLAENRIVKKSVISESLSTGLLIDLEESCEPVHFDSIPLPGYPGPGIPTNSRRHTATVSEYLQPVSKSQTKATSEPIYAKIIKKPKLPPNTISTSMHQPQLTAFKAIS